MSNKPTTIQFWRGNLPHWEVADGRYFVTMRLAGCLPRQALDRLHELAGATPAPNDDAAHLAWSRRYFAVQEQALHNHSQRAWLHRPDIAEKTLSAALHYDRTGKWRLSACAVMPNHIHLFFMAGPDGMSKIMRDFKHATARMLGPLIPEKSGHLWQKEWFDHWSRSAQEDEKIRGYIRDNAVQAGLVRKWNDWRWCWLCGEASP